MKKTIYIILGLCVIVLGTVIITKMNKQEEVETPAQRYQQTVSSESEKDVDNVEKNNVLEYGQFTFEFLSYEVIDDSEIKSQDKYPAKWFYNNELPPEVLLEETEDEEAIRAECPELAAMWDNPDNYTLEETHDIYYSNIEIIEKYTYEMPVDMKYVFVKCRITSNHSTGQLLELADWRLLSTSKDKETWIDRDNICYFDKSTHLEGDDRVHSFFSYGLKSKASFECTIGFCLRDEIEDADLYIGVVDAMLQENGENPVNGKIMLQLEPILNITE